MKKIFILFIIISYFNACAVSKHGISHSGPDGSYSEVKTEEGLSSGEDKMLEWLGMGAAIAAIFAVAPKEAYR